MSHSTTLLQQVQASANQGATTANELFDAHSPSSFGGRRGGGVSTGLTWGYYGGPYWVHGALALLANGTVTLTASATNYVEFDPVAGTVSKNTTGFTNGQVPLYTVVTNTTTPTSWTDQRGWINRPLLTIFQNTITAFAGGGQGSATLLTGTHCRVSTVASAGDSVKLPAAPVHGREVWIINRGANSMDVFPNTGHSIDDGAANTAVAQAVGKAALYKYLSTNNWYRTLGA
jgi:hypothetical protein